MTEFQSQAREPAWTFGAARREQDFDLSFRNATDGPIDEAFWRETAQEMLAGVPDFGPVRAHWDIQNDELILRCDCLAAQVKRTIKLDETRERCVWHDEFSLHPAFQGAGYGPRMMRGSLHAYDRLGLRFVYVEADNVKGGYTWARLGFAIRDAEADDMRLGLLEVLEIPSRQAELGIGDRRARYVETILASENHRLMFNVACLADENGPYGKQLLLGSSWGGYIDLLNSDHRTLLNEAIAR
ncbi:hypothetical protein IHQ68_08315 [Chelatococcus sambhunathii]|uniref:N-acetyltransferase domain-containing protein n=1 Tax=Chelatococcus sambhunathii TaxID=363953 RepID=A0ABU1DFD4_9HYPH|nr:hypothetical protein [Chelatococcus sambhunathii]MDR4306620.1 hypothetical protein [Chelatococcus sambhunathii]